LAKRQAKRGDRIGDEREREERRDIVVLRLEQRHGDRWGFPAFLILSGNMTWTQI
jgi:hypothetical protein